VQPLGIENRDARPGSIDEPLLLKLGQDSRHHLTDGPDSLGELLLGDLSGQT